MINSTSFSSPSTNVTESPFMKDFNIYSLSNLNLTLTFPCRTTFISLGTVTVHVLRSTALPCNSIDSGLPSSLSVSSISFLFFVLQEKHRNKQRSNNIHFNIRFIIKFSLKFLQRFL